MDERIKYMAFHITYVCENKCPYCYIGNEGRKKHPPLEKVKKIIKKLAQDDVKEILLVGGNPCTYPYLKEIVELIKKLNMGVYILSNTLDFSKDLDFFIENINGFETTILGSTPEEHDYETKKRGAYDILLKNIKLLNDRGKAIEVWISLYKGNFNKIFGIVKNLVENEKIKIRELGIQRIIPCGRAENTLRFSLAKKHIPTIFEQLHKVKNIYNLKIDIEDPFPLCIIDKKYQYLQAHPCEWGFTKCSINFDGDLVRCGADGRFLLGNIFEVGNLQKFWRENPTLVDFRNKKWLPEKCQKCKLLKKCSGGCSLSKITEKDHECDILCPYYQKG